MNFLATLVVGSEQGQRQGGTKAKKYKERQRNTKTQRGVKDRCGNSLKRWEFQTTLPASWETCMQVKKQQLESDMKQ